MAELPRAKRDPSFEPRRLASDFAARYPEGDRSASEVVLNLTLAGVAAVNRVEEVLAEFGLVLRTFNVLVVVAGGPGPLTPTVVAERTLIAKTTLTSALDALERLRLVRREPNPASRRSILIRTTTRGEAVADQALTRLHAHEARWLAQLPERDRQTLIELLGHAKGLLGAAGIQHTTRRGTRGANRQ